MPDVTECSIISKGGRPHWILEAEGWLLGETGSAL